MAVARDIISKYANQATLETYFVSVLGLISVKSYGAFGDGSTDDSAAITLALAALSDAGGSSLYFPTGVYKVDNVTVTAASFAGLYLWGDNSSFDGISLGINQIGAAATSGIAVLTTEGDMLYRGPATEERLPKGTAGQMLVMNSGETAPEWVDSPSLVAPNEGSITYTNGAGELVELPKGADGQVLTMNSAETSPEWSDGLKSVAPTPGDIIYTDDTGEPVSLPKGTDGQVLTMNSTETGPEWSDGLKSVAPTPGDIIYTNATGDPTPLAKGTANQLFGMNSGATAPEWKTYPIIWTGTLAAYNALGSYDSNTLYFCT